MAELKPCPFCGETATVVEHKYKGYFTHYGVACVLCDSQTRLSYTSEKSAIAAWNRRTCDASAVDAVRLGHGRWVGLEYDSYADGCPVYDKWECSMCGDEHKGEECTLPNYCPNCGAEMDGKDGENNGEKV